MGAAQNQLQALNHGRCAKCFSRRCTCGLIIFLTIGHPGLPPQVSVSHHQNPSVLRTQSCRRIQANRRHRGGRTASPAALPGGKTGRRCRSQSPLLSLGGPCEAHTRPLAASVLGGAACNTKGVCGRGCVGGFRGPPAGPSWPPPPYTHPFGALSPPLS